MKKLLLTIIFIFFVQFIFAQTTFHIFDANSKEPIEGAIIKLFKQFKVDGRAIDQYLNDSKKTDKSGNATFVLTKKTGDYIRYLVISYPNYKNDTITNFSKTDYGLKKLIRAEKFQIKLLTLSKQLSKEKLNELKSKIDVENINVIKRKSDNKYAYVTSPIENFRNCQNQLDAIVNSGEKSLKEAYILHYDTQKKVYFKFLFKTANKWMTKELKDLKSELEPNFKLDQIISSDSRYRIVSEKSYLYYQSAMKDYLSFVRNTPQATKTLILIYTKSSDGQIDVINTLNIL